MLFLVYGPGGGFGVGKSTLTSTIMYVLKTRYNIDSVDPDRDDEPNSRNNETLEKLKKDDPDRYATLCDQDYLSKLILALKLDMPVFLNGDWSPRIPKLQEHLKQIIQGTLEGQIEPRKIMGLLCDCDFEIQFERMEKRGKARDKGYVANKEEYKKIFDDRYARDLETVQVLLNCGISCTTVNIAQTFKTVKVALNNKDTEILNYDGDTKVQEFIDPIIASLGLKPDLSLSPASGAIKFSGSPGLKSSMSAFKRPRGSSGVDRDLLPSNRGLPRSFSTGALEIESTRDAFSPAPFMPAFTLTQFKHISESKRAGTSRMNPFESTASAGAAAETSSAHEMPEVYLPEAAIVPSQEPKKRKNSEDSAKSSSKRRMNPFESTSSAGSAAERSSDPQATPPSHPQNKRTKPSSAGSGKAGISPKKPKEQPTQKPSELPAASARRNLTVTFEEQRTSPRPCGMDVRNEATNHEISGMMTRNKSKKSAMTLAFT